MKITITILLFFLVILVGGELRASLMANETLTVQQQQSINQEGTGDIATKANKTPATQKAANELMMQEEQAAVTKALQLYKLEHGNYPTTQQDIQTLVEQTLMGKMQEKQRPKESHDGDSDVLSSVADNNDAQNSVADKKYVDDEPVIAVKQESTMKQESIESSVTMGGNTEVTSMVDLIKTEILIFAVTFTAVLAVIFDKQLLLILKLLFGSLKNMTRNKAESVTS